MLTSTNTGRFGRSEARNSFSIQPFKSKVLLNEYRRSDKKMHVLRKVTVQRLQYSRTKASGKKESEGRWRLSPPWKWSRDTGEESKRRLGPAYKKTFGARAIYPNPLTPVRRLIKGNQNLSANSRAKS